MPSASLQCGFAKVQCMSCAHNIEEFTADLHNYCAKNPCPNCKEHMLSFYDYERMTVYTNSEVDALKQRADNYKARVFKE